MTKGPFTRQALISVADKSGVVSLAKQLSASGFEIISTGGTAHLLQEHHISVTELSRYTAFPEIMDGRVKTLHPKIFGGILARGEFDKAIMAEWDIHPFELVIVNLYPFAETIAHPEHTFDDAIENIDIGGVSLIRAAAKNHAHVTVIVDSNDYSAITNMLSTDNAISAETRLALAKKAFAYTANYDTTITHYLNTIHHDGPPEFPQKLTLDFNKKQDLRYGENPHQQAALYLQAHPPSATIATSIQHQGKALSFNNLVDADTALECVKEFGNTPAVCIVKHANPCGVALDATIDEAYKRAYQTDPTSAFGGIIACNKKIEADTALKILQQQFVEVIVAPEFSDQALHVFSSKPNVRLLAYGADHTCHNSNVSFDIKRIQGGILIQDFDQQREPPPFNVVTQRAPSEKEIADLLFAWRVAKFVKSNAIVFAKNEMTIGIGAGQMSRVYSTRIAEIKARDENLEIKNSVMASDAFFPFRDSIDAAAALDITAIIQPGGSVRDPEIIAAADEANIAMVFTGIRHFRH